MTNAIVKAAPVPRVDRTPKPPFHVKRYLSTPSSQPNRAMSLGRRCHPAEGTSTRSRTHTFARWSIPALPRRARGSVILQPGSFPPWARMADAPQVSNRVAASLVHIHPRSAGDTHHRTGCPDSSPPHTTDRRSARREKQTDKERENNNRRSTTKEQRPRNNGRRTMSEETSRRPSTPTRRWRFERVLVHWVSATVTDHVPARLILSGRDPQSIKANITVSRETTVLSRRMPSLTTADAPRASDETTHSFPPRHASW